MAIVSYAVGGVQDPPLDRELGTQIQGAGGAGRRLVPLNNRPFDDRPLVVHVVLVKVRLLALPEVS